MLISQTESINLNSLKDKKVTLVTGIANPKPLKDFLVRKGIIYDEIEFEDHHNFSTSEISQLENLDTFIITTEKDYVRMWKVKSPKVVLSTHKDSRFMILLNLKN